MAMPTLAVEVGFWYANDPTSRSDAFVLGSKTKGRLGVGKLGPVIYSTPTELLVLDDATYGKLDSARLGPIETWTDLVATGDVIDVEVSRGRNDSLDEWDPGTCTVLLRNDSGRWDPNNTSSPYSPAQKPGKPLRVLLDGEPIWQGYIDRWTLDYSHRTGRMEATIEATDGLKMLSRNYVAEWDPPTGEGETTDERVVRILDEGQWPDGMRDIATSTLECVGMDGQATVLSLLQEVTESERGELFMSRDGNVTWRDRWARFSDTVSTDVQVTFDDDGTGDAGYIGIELDYDDSEIINEARVRPGYADATQRVATDDESKAEYLSAVRTIDTILLNDNDCDLYAAWLVSRYADPTLRVRSVTVAPREDSTVWDLVRGLDIGHRVRVKRTPPGGATTDVQAHVEGIGWQFPADLDWQVLLRLSTVQPDLDDYMVLDDATSGKLDTGGVLGY